MFLKNFGKVLFVFGAIQFMIPFIVGSEYFINIFSIVGMLCLADALAIALAEKYIWLHAIATFAIVGSCLWGYIVAYSTIFWRMLILFIVYMFALASLRIRKIILCRLNK